MNDEQPPTAFGSSLVGAVNELSRATWPVVPSLLAAVLVAVFGSSFLAIVTAWALFVLWLYVGITREAGSGAAVLGVVSRLVRLRLAVTAAASAVAGVVAGFQMDERAFFLGFSAVTGRGGCPCRSGRRAWASHASPARTSLVSGSAGRPGLEVRALEDALAAFREHQRDFLVREEAARSDSDAGVTP